MAVAATFRVFPMVGETDAVTMARQIMANACDAIVWAWQLALRRS